MYKTIIKIKDDIPDSALHAIHDVVSGAFLNRAGALKNVSASPYEFIFESDESGYGCLELGMFSLRRQQSFLDHVASWSWIDADPDESCNMLEVFARHAV